MKGKLIRDKVTELARENGDELVVEEIVSEGEYLEALREKLVEEALEVKKANRDEVAEELADVVEVVRALGEVFGVDWAEIEDKRQEKLTLAGGFRKRLRIRK